MTTRRTHRMSRGAAERLLNDGPAAPGATSDPLARLLAAAAAPAQARELAGEEPAVAAFHAEHLSPLTESRRGQMIKSPLAKLLTTKVLAGTIAVCATGGVALAASNGAFSAGGGGGLHVGASSSGVSATGTARRSQNARSASVASE